MPVERVSKGFKDISATFQVNPLNEDLIILRDANAIARSIRNLIFTVPGDKPFEPFLGSRVSRLLFDQIDKITSHSIQSTIEYTINTYEPRVKLNSVKVEPNDEMNAYDVQIEYTIIGIDVGVQQLTFALEATR